MSKNLNRQGFLNRVEDIKNMESDVDRLLAAARLCRIESVKRPISTALRIAAIFAIMVITVLMVWLDFTASEYPSYFSVVISMCGIGAVCAALFCGQESG